MNRYTKLLTWYLKQSYNFPWRDNKNPYNIWISEIMLQQTQVQTVIPYYTKWIAQYPTIEKLNTSSIDQLLLLWQGLGYYRRVHNILSTAKIVCLKYNNQLPELYDDLITLPGIGDYTASMILSISFNDNNHVPIDGNIKRIMSRLYMLPKHQETMKNYKYYATHYIHPQNPGDSIQALMDIGREICKPKLPQCTQCPLKQFCQSYQKDVVEQYPHPKSTKAIPEYHVVVGIIWRHHKFIISKRPKDKLLGDLWEFPGGKIQNNETKLECLKREIKEELDIEIYNEIEIGDIKHQYSHMKLKITLFNCEYYKGKAKPLASQKITWIDYSEINLFAFPRATHKLFELINSKNEDHL